MDDKTKKYNNVLENTIEINRFAKTKKWTYYAEKTEVYVTWPKLFLAHTHKRENLGIKVIIIRNNFDYANCARTEK